LVNLISGQGKVVSTRSPYGVVPWLLPRATLERKREQWVPDDLNRGVDINLALGLRLDEWQFVDPNPQARVDFKSDLNMTPYFAGRYSELDDPWDSLAAVYPAELVHMAKELHAEFVVAA
ncbi:MAG TPA: hypothetical protein VJW23_04810, partial [Propionibacteriaceae bacterium]|nr:hypothetical protein [Propionibacteriaceae bacterium]